MIKSALSYINNKILGKKLAKSNNRPRKYFMENQGQMIEKLQTYYVANGICPLNFKCAHYSSCVSRAQNKQKFTKGHGIWIGTEYEKSKVPKLLFLSLDSGSAELDPNKRTMEAAREWNLKWLPGKGDKPRHWYRTQQFAWHVFNEFNNTFNTALDIGNVDANHDFNPLTEIHKIKPYYAATNSAKCCMNNEKRKQADLTLFKNCKEYILGELEILRPDILVTQGDPARAVAEEMKKRTQLIKSENISQANKNKDDFHILKLTDGRVLLWIHHYHPTNFGAFKKNRDEYKTYAKKAVEFIKTSPRSTDKSFSVDTNDKFESLSDRAPEADLEMGERRKTQTQDFKNGKMETKGQVKKLNVLEKWKYTREWLDIKYGDGFDKKDEISQALQSDMASLTIRYYVDDGSELAPVQRHINRFIDMINEGQFDKCKDYMEKWNFIERLESLPNNLLEDTVRNMDQMHAYNYQKAPAQVVQLIDNIDKKRREAKEILDVLVKQLKDIAKNDEQKELDEQEYNYQEFSSDYEREQAQDEMAYSKIRSKKMRYEPFDLSTNYVLGKNGYTVRPQQGTGLVITILFEYTENGTGITEEALNRPEFDGDSIV